MSRQTRRSRFSSEEVSDNSSIVSNANSSSEKSAFRLQSQVSTVYSVGVSSLFNDPIKDDDPILAKYNALKNIDIEGMVAQAYDELPIHRIEDTDIDMSPLMGELNNLVLDPKKKFTKDEVVHHVTLRIIAINNHYANPETLPPDGFEYVHTAGPDSFLHCVFILEWLIGQGQLMLTDANIPLAIFCALAIGASNEDRDEGKTINLKKFQVIFRSQDKQYLIVVMTMLRAIGEELDLTKEELEELLDRFLPPRNEI